MERKMLKQIENKLTDLRKVRDLQQMKFKEVRKYAPVRLSIGKCKNGISYYNAKKKDKWKYQGNDNNQVVKKIKEARFLELSIKTLEEDIALAEGFLSKYKLTSFRDINSSLPKTYRLPGIIDIPAEKIAENWKQKGLEHKAKFDVPWPEDLKHKTIDGNYTRSKSEALIYNHLYEEGYTFIYELPIETDQRVFYPDFTILSEIDYVTTVKIEHQGMMSDPTYKDRSENREFDYWNAGFLPQRDIFFTYDDNRGGFDMGPIDEILRMRVRPNN